jgi:hypothetical protein
MRVSNNVYTVSVIPFGPGDIVSCSRWGYFKVVEILPFTPAKNHKICKLIRICTDNGKPTRHTKVTTRIEYVKKVDIDEIYQARTKETEQLIKFLRDSKETPQ